MANSDDYPQKIGKTMISMAWLVILLLLTWFFHNWYYPNQTVEGQVSVEGVREVKLKRNPQGHYLASGMVNQQAVVFLLDTGATDVALSEELADKLQLRKIGPISVMTAVGEVKAYHSVLKQVQLGNIILYNITATVLPNASGDEVLLGMSFLKHLELIQRGDSLLIRQL